MQFPRTQLEITHRNGKRLSLPLFFTLSAGCSAKNQIVVTGSGIDLRWLRLRYRRHGYEAQLANGSTLVLRSGQPLQLDCFRLTVQDRPLFGGWLGLMVSTITTALAVWCLRTPTLQAGHASDRCFQVRVWREMGNDAAATQVCHSSDCDCLEKETP